MWQRLKNNGNIKQNKRKLNDAEPDESNHPAGPSLKKIRLSSSSIDGAEQAVSNMFLERPLAASNSLQEAAHGLQDQSSDESYDSYTATGVNPRNEPQQEPDSAPVSKDTTRAENGSSRDIWSR